MSSSLTNIEHFQEFTDHPKSSEKQTILGSIKYIEDSIVNKEKGPTCNTLIHLFNQFEGTDVEDDKPKKYVYMRMRRPLLLELALSVLKEIATGDPDRAENLTLAVRATKSKGKVVEVKPPSPGEFPLSTTSPLIARGLRFRSIVPVGLESEAAQKALE